MQPLNGVQRLSNAGRIRYAHEGARIRIRTSSKVELDLPSISLEMMSIRRCKTLVVDPFQPTAASSFRRLPTWPAFGAILVNSVCIVGPTPSVGGRPHNRCFGLGVSFPGSGPAIEGLDNCSGARIVIYEDLMVCPGGDFFHDFDVLGRVHQCRSRVFQ